MKFILSEIIMYMIIYKMTKMNKKIIFLSLCLCVLFAQFFCDIFSSRIEKFKLHILNYFVLDKIIGNNLDNLNCFKLDKLINYNLHNRDEIITRPIQTDNFRIPLIINGIIFNNEFGVFL